MKNLLLCCLVLSPWFVAFAPAQVIDGGGTTDYVPLWTSTSMLGNSKFFQSGGKIGLGTTAPAASLDILGANGVGFTGPAGTVLNVKGGTGGPLASGGGIQLTSGSGGSYSTGSGGKGGSIMVTGGQGAICLPASTRCGGYASGKGGSIVLEAGSGAPYGNVILVPSGGKVGIGTTSPTAELYVNGSSVVTGTKSALVETTSYGKRRLYAVESPENWFEDFGTAKLAGGQAIVKLDSVFAQTVNANEYHVFLTPKGDCDGLYVARQSVNAFEVRELRHGNDSIAFDYRIVAKRKGYEGIRLAQESDAGNPENAEDTLATK